MVDPSESKLVKGNNVTGVDLDLVFGEGLYATRWTLQIYWS